MNARRLRDLVLLPAALLVVVLEDVIWAGLRAILRGLMHWPPLKRLKAAMGRLPGWVALPLFLLTEGIGKIGDAWFLWLLAHGRPDTAVLVYGGVRLVSTLMAVFIYHACEPALLRYAWFAAVHGCALRVRDWALALIATWRRALPVALRRPRSPLAWRFAALRQALALHVRRAPDR